jgi:imidazolonepropionase-like amidohydrolase
MLVGSESGFALIPYGHWHAREMETFVKYLGYSSTEVIVIATKLNSLTVGLEGKLGTIEKEMLADLIVVDGDPLADIAVLQDVSKINVVMKNGVLVDLDRPWPEKKDWGYEQTICFGWRRAENPAVQRLGRAGQARAA